MNFRRIVMVSGSHLVKRVCTTVVAPASASVETSVVAAAPSAAAGVKAGLLVTNDGSSASAEKAKVAAREQRKKRKMFVKLRIIMETGGAVKKTLNEFIMRQEEEGVCITQEDLCRWVKHLDKNGKHKHAHQIFEWMEKKKMTFSPSQLATFADLKTKGLAAALDYFEKVDPDFDNMDPDAKNWPAYAKLCQCVQKDWDDNRCLPFFR